MYCIKGLDVLNAVETLSLGHLLILSWAKILNKMTTQLPATKDVWFLFWWSFHLAQKKYKDETVGWYWYSLKKEKSMN